MLHQRFGNLALQMNTISDKVEASQAQPEDSAEDRTISRVNGWFFLHVVLKRALVFPVFRNWVWLELFAKLALVAKETTGVIVGISGADVFYWQMLAFDRSESFLEFLVRSV